MKRRVDETAARAAAEAERRGRLASLEHYRCHDISSPVADCPICQRFTRRAA
jgi:hypothetical protein